MVKVEWGKLSQKTLRALSRIKTKSNMVKPCSCCETPAWVQLINTVVDFFSFSSWLSLVISTSSNIIDLLMARQGGVKKSQSDARFLVWRNCACWSQLATEGHEKNLSILWMLNQCLTYCAAVSCCCIRGRGCNTKGLDYMWAGDSCGSASCRADRASWNQTWVLAILLFDHFMHSVLMSVKVVHARWYVLEWYLRKLQQICLSYRWS